MHSEISQNTVILYNRLRAVRAANSKFAAVQTAVRNDISKCNGNEKDTNDGAVSRFVRVFSS